jgi:hypothetical protein
MDGKRPQKETPRLRPQTQAGRQRNRLCYDGPNFYRNRPASQGETFGAFLKIFGRNLKGGVH